MKTLFRKCTLSFSCTEKESIDFKLRLKYDGFSQRLFFTEIIRLYIERDPAMLNLVDSIKRGKRTMAKSKISKSRKEDAMGANLLSDLGISSAEKQKIFDLIEKERDYD